MSLQIADALQVNVQQADAARFPRIIDRAQRGAIEVAMHLCVLEKFACPDHPLHVCPLSEMVVDSVHFAAARASRGVRDDQCDLLARCLICQQSLHQCSLPGARRPADHQEASARRPGPHTAPRIGPPALWMGGFSAPLPNAPCPDKNRSQCRGHWHLSQRGDGPLQMRQGCHKCGSRPPGHRGPCSCMVHVGSSSASTCTMPAGLQHNVHY
mmetsp:Transcript_77930/g.215420  ORF Transcript_77930/g.215420 Transcript_77930/m.215420 type:complete len:212 (+) Transcript_77930:1799-2434(+)